MVYALLVRATWLVDNGGDPGERFYGVEPMVRLGWTYLDHLHIDLEGAALFPGAALEDERGKAVRSSPSVSVPPVCRRRNRFDRLGHIALQHMAFDRQP